MSVLNHIHSVSKSRLNPCIEICKKSANNQLDAYKLAICVYTSLQHRTGIFYALIQEIEIAVRNEISRVLKHYAAPNKDLLDYFCFLACDQQSKLSPASVDSLKKCLADLLKIKPKQISDSQNTKNNLIQKGLNENDIIASITFGFWVHFLNSNRGQNPHYLYWSSLFHQRLFNKKLSNKQIFDRLKFVLTFRNRLYHQEFVWKGKNISTPEKALINLAKKYNYLLESLKLFAPERFNLRDKATWQRWQDDFNFEQDVFSSEIQKMLETSFI